MRSAFETGFSTARQSSAPPFGFSAFAAVMVLVSSFRSALRSIPITGTSPLLRPLLTPARRPTDVSVRRAGGYASVCPQPMPDRSPQIRCVNFPCTTAAFTFPSCQSGFVMLC